MLTLTDIVFYKDNIEIDIIEHKREDRARKGGIEHKKTRYTHAPTHPKKSRTTAAQQSSKRSLTIHTIHPIVELNFDVFFLHLHTTPHRLISFSFSSSSSDI